MGIWGALSLIIVLQILCLLRRFEVDSCVNSIIPNIYCTYLVFGVGVSRQFGVYMNDPFIARVLNLPPRAYRIIGR